MFDTIRELERCLHEGALLKPYIHGRTNRRSMCSVDETVCCAWCGLGYGERNRFDCWPGPTVKKSVESCFPPLFSEVLLFIVEPPNYTATARATGSLADQLRFH